VRRIFLYRIRYLRKIDVRLYVGTLYKTEIVGFSKPVNGSEKNSRHALYRLHLREPLNFCNWKKRIRNVSMFAIQIERWKKASREVPCRSAFRRVLRRRSPVFFAYSISSGTRSGAHCTRLEKYYYACIVSLANDWIHARNYLRGGLARLLQ